MKDLAELLHDILAATDECDALSQFKTGFDKLQPVSVFYCNGSPINGEFGLQDKFQQGRVVGSLVNEEVSRTILGDKRLLRADRFPKYCKENFLPFVWECDPTSVDDKWEREFFSLPADFGITGGVTVPIHNSDCKTYGNLTLFFNRRHKRSTHQLKHLLHDIHVAVLYLDVKLSRPKRPKNGYRQLAPRERDCLSLLSSGLQISQIADHLVLSDATVSEYLGNARKKLRARTSAEAVAIAVQHRLIEI